MKTKLRNNPNQDNILKIADHVKNSKKEYLVIDAGWYINGSGWSNSHGEWKFCSDAFPDGLKYLTGEIRKKGLIPGIWFEFETIGKNSAAVNKSLLTSIVHGLL